MQEDFIAIEGEVRRQNQRRFAWVDVVDRKRAELA
jgi:hypothetical protein